MHFVLKSLLDELARRSSKKEHVTKKTGADFRTVMIVEYSKYGELAKTMRELTGRLEEVIGFKVKLVERAGASLKSLFPTNNLWEGQKCGRKDCTMCEQGAEMLPSCTKSSLLYENICGLCNPKSGEDRELCRSETRCFHTFCWGDLLLHL